MKSLSLRDKLPELAVRQLVETMKECGWAVELSDQKGYLIIFTAPGEQPNSVIGETPEQALSELCRNLYQSGSLPKPLREMMYQLDDRFGTPSDENQS